MSKLTWDNAGERFYETGVSNGVLFVLQKNGKYKSGVAWNGLTAITESPSGAEPTDLYADNIKYLSLMSAEDLGLTIEAYNSPDEFKECDGSIEISTGFSIHQQPRKAFGLCYKTIIGNDVENNDYGYKIHLVFNAKVSPSERGYSTVNDTPEAITFSWEASTTPVSVTGYKPTASVVIESAKLIAAGLYNVLTAIEDLLFGTDSTDSTLPTPNEIMEVFETEMYLLDSDGEALLDSSGDKIQSFVYD